MAESNTNGEFPTTLGPDAHFKGELQFEKGVRLLGNFEGTILTKGKLHIASGAQMSADVDAGDIQVEGSVKGNLRASGKVNLKSSAKLEGDLHTAKLEVAEGAVFVGKCVVGPQSEAKAPAQSTSTPAPQATHPKRPGAPQPVGAGK